MSLADIAAADYRTILNADGDIITVQSPEGVETELRANTQDISHAIDPSTGVLVKGRTCSVALSKHDLQTANIDPIAVLDNKSGKPWIVRFVETVSRQEHVFKVRETKPDRTIGGLILILEFYK